MKRQRGGRWSADEDAALERLYPIGGVAAVHAVTGRSKSSIINRASLRGVSCDWASIAEKAEPLTPVPRMDLMESLECVRFRKAFAELDKTVQHGPMVPALGRAAA